ncbi:MAG: amidohydrolase family protein [Armatimonadota bacterium]|nr:amidohydrolase family protein [Armatimonadota bacterium]
MIDFHQHIGHYGRTLDHVLAHLEGIGADRAVLLPLEDPEGGGLFPTETVLEAAAAYPDRVVPFCHVDVHRHDVLQRITRMAEAGCRGYGEQKQRLSLQDPALLRVLSLCNDLQWPVTLHIEEGRGGYNTDIRFLPTLLRRFPHVSFIGHAQSFWAHISARVPDPTETLYPKGRVVPGGLIDRWLGEYPNLYADLSAGSGHNALARDEEFAREFLARHSHKLLFASDCPCRDGHGDGFAPGCIAQQTLALLRRLAPGPEALQRILHHNAARLLCLEAS